MKNFKKVLSLVLAMVMVLSCIPFASASGTISGNSQLTYSLSNPSFATLSDVHVYTEELVENGAKDYKKDIQNGKVLSESFPIVNAGLTAIEDAVANRGLRYLFLTGDLACNGEKDCHRLLGDLLRSFQDTMRQKYDPEFHIFVTPGNHDINYYKHAAYYDADGNKVKATSSLEAAEKLVTHSKDFAYYYRELGFGAEDSLADKITYYKTDIGLDTFTKDNPCTFDDEYANLSYMVDLKDANGQDFRLISIDGCIYSDDVTDSYITIEGQTFPHQETGSYMDDNHLNWIINNTKAAKSKDIPVVGINHFAVVPQINLQAAVIKMFIYDNWQSMASKLADAGMHYFFSGHVHSNDVSAYTSEAGNTIYNVETGSLINYVNTYRENYISGTFDDIDFDTCARACDAVQKVDLSKVWYGYDENGDPIVQDIKYCLDKNGNPYKEISKPFSDNFGLYLFLHNMPLADENGDTRDWTFDENGHKKTPDMLGFAKNMLDGYLEEFLDDIAKEGGTKKYIEKTLGQSLEDFIDTLADGETISVSVISLKKSDLAKVAEMVCDEIDRSYINGGNKQAVIDAVNEIIDDLLNFKLGEYTLNEIATKLVIEFYHGDECIGEDIWTNVDLQSVYNTFADENSTAIKQLMDFLVKELLGYDEVVTDSEGKETVQRNKGKLIPLLSKLNLSVDMIAQVLPDFAGILRYPAVRKLLLGTTSKTPSVIEIVDAWGGRIKSKPYTYVTFETGATQEKKVTDTGTLVEAILFGYVDDYLTDDQIQSVSRLIYNSFSALGQDPLFTESSAKLGPYKFIDNYDLKNKGLVSGTDSAASINFNALTPKAPEDAWYKIPNSVAVTFGEDETTQKNFNWFTTPYGTGTDVQVIPYTEGATAADFTADKLLNVTVEASCKTIKMTYPTMDIGILAMGESMDMNRHIAEVSGLKPGTKYTYRVGDAAQNIWAAPATMETAAGNNSPFSFLYMSDPQSQTKEQYDETYGKLLDNAFANYPDAKFIMNGGDMVDYGANMLQWSWALGQKQIDDTTLISTAGNHEPKGTNGKDSLLTTYFGPSQDTFFDIEHPEQDVSEGVYYDVDYNDAHIMVLNTNNLDEDKKLSADQLAWLAESASSSDKTWNIVMMHKSIYSNASHFDDDDVVALRKQLAKVMPQLGIDLVLSGHDHIFVRTQFMTDGAITGTFDENDIGTNQNGTVYLIPGKSGVKDYKLKTDEEVSKYFSLEGMKRVNVNSQDSYSALSIDGDSLNVKTYLMSEDASSSEVIDNFTINKTKLDAPKNLKAETASRSSIKLSWNASKDAKNYTVYRSDAKTGNYEEIATVTGTSYKDTGLDSAKTYYYKVVANKDGASSEPSNIAKAKTYLGSVSKLSATKNNATSIKTSWKKLTGAKTYKVYYSTSSGSGYKLAGTVTGSSYTIKGLKSGQTYYIKVCANDGSHDGSFGNIIKVKL